MHCRRRLCAGAGPEETLALVSLRLWSSKRPGFDHNPRVVWLCSSIYSGAICDIGRRRSSTMTVGRERDSFFDVHQQGRIEAPERLIAELLLKNEAQDGRHIDGSRRGSKQQQRRDTHERANCQQTLQPGGGRTMPNRSTDILIVEDKNSLRQTPAPIFSAVGDLVRPAVDGIPALNEITQRVPDVAISDLNMPGMSDVEFLSIVGDRSLKSS